MDVSVRVSLGPLRRMSDGISPVPSKQRLWGHDEPAGRASTLSALQAWLQHAVCTLAGVLLWHHAVQERQASHAQAGPTRNVTVQRAERIQEARAGLPVLGMEQEIMEAITGNDVCLLCGETGSGKTTQVTPSLQWNTTLALICINRNGLCL